MVNVVCSMGPEVVWVVRWELFKDVRSRSELKVLQENHRCGPFVDQNLTSLSYYDLPHPQKAERSIVTLFRGSQTVARMRAGDAGSGAYMYSLSRSL
jgi:hypothetical protein